MSNALKTLRARLPLLRVPRLAILPLAALLAAATAPAWALPLNDWDLRSRTIPAAACAARDSSQAALIELVQGAWRFSGSNTGRVTLSCPLPISYFPADAAQAGGITPMNYYRVWYRDSDGAANSAALTVVPYVRLAPLGTWSNVGLLGGGGGIAPPGVCQFNSNGHPDMTFMATVQACAHNISTQALYTFEVTLMRTATTQAVEFHGIDFVDDNTAVG